MLTICAPDSYHAEREYIFHVVFSCFLGIDYTVNYESNLNAVVIRGEKSSISITDGLFSVEKTEWLSDKCLPVLPLKKGFLCEEIDFNINSIPVLYGHVLDSGKYLEVKDGDVSLGIDIFGSSFFMLTRLEEYIVNDRDVQDRFPVEASIAYKAGFLERPIVNEYVEILWCLLKKIEPSLVRKNQKYKVLPTHDIDKPFDMMFETPLQISRHFVGDILYRKSVYAMLKRVRDVYQLNFNKKKYISRKTETYDFIDAISSKHNLKDIFFFMNSKKSWYDGNYTIDEPHVLCIISKLVSKGHHIGLHPSFDSYMDVDEIKKEVALMNDVFTNNKLPLLVGARQHYLKWKNPDTWQHYEDAGIPFDSSMTYAGHVGFRCGVCYPFPVFNLETRKELKLIEHPLIVMDGTLYEYMGLSHDEALPVIKKLADECKKYNGEFVILWHNTMLDCKNERDFYSKMLDEVNC